MIAQINEERLLAERQRLRVLKAKLVKNSGIEVHVTRKLKLLNRAIHLYRTVHG